MTWKNFSVVKLSSKVSEQKKNHNKVGENVLSLSVANCLTVWHWVFVYVCLWSGVTLSSDQYSYCLVKMARLFSFSETIQLNQKKN